MAITDKELNELMNNTDAIRDIMDLYGVPWDVAEKLWRRFVGTIKKLGDLK